MKREDGFKKVIATGLIMAGAFFVGRIFQGTKDVVSVLNNAEEVNPGSKKQIIATIVADTLTKKTSK